MQDHQLDTILAGYLWMDRIDLIPRQSSHLRLFKSENPKLKADYLPLIVLNFSGLYPSMLGHKVTLRFAPKLLIVL